MRAISAFLQKRHGRMLMRTWLILALCVANFLLSCGIAFYFNRGASPVLMIISGIVSVGLVAILSVPNMETDEGQEDGKEEQPT